MAITEKQRRRREDAKLAYAAFIEFYPLSLDDLPDEQWRPITDKYQVSTYGRVKSFKGKTPRILKPQLSRSYLGVTLYIGGKKKQYPVHVLVAKAFIPNPENKPEVNHRVGMKFNCHVDNLEWNTHAENNQHAVKNGLAKSGIDRPDAKIQNEADIIYIRDNPDNLSRQELAEKFGMTPAAIGLIQLGKRYPNEGGTPRKPKPYTPRIADEIRAKVKADWATGNYTQRAIARKHGISHTSVQQILREGQ